MKLFNKSNKAFIIQLLIISLPIILQSLFTNLASLIDTLMVGQLDNASLSGVYIATQVIFVVNIILFGSVEGATIFYCQFKGNNDKEHMQNTFAFKILSSTFIGLISILIVLTSSESLAGLFTKDIEEIRIASNYMRLLCISFIPFGLTVSITSTLKEEHHSIWPMIVTLIGVVVNVVINYLLIFGIGIFPKLGATGAAIGTIVDRLVELLGSIILTIILKMDFSKNLLKRFIIPSNLFKNLVIKSIPLVLNELLWSLGQTTLVYIFTQKESIATSVLPIVSTIFNLVLVVSIGLGNGISIIIGNIIGTNDLNEAQNKSLLSLFFTFVIMTLFALILFICSPSIVSLYTKVSEEARTLALTLLEYQCIYLVITSLNMTLFFLLRAGGRSFLVFLFDSAFAWIISIPVALMFLHLLPGLSFAWLYVLIYLLDLIKTIIGLLLIFSKKWHKNIINEYSKSNV